MRLAARALAIEAADRKRGHAAVERCALLVGRVDEQRLIAFARNLGRHAGEQVVDDRARQADRLEIIAVAIAGDNRSEKHTPELQSLMRISYAVFHMKKKRKTLIRGE